MDVLPQQLPPARPNRQGIAPAIARWALVACLIAIPTATVTWRVMDGGLGALVYDECEYVQFAIETYDRLIDRGLLRWPLTIANDQHYAKPPLYVNALSLGLLLVGRPAVATALGLVSGLAVASLLTITWALLRRIAGPRAAVFALLAIGAVPSFQHYSGAVYPEAIITLLVVGAFAVMFWPSEIFSYRRAALLGLLGGLGILSKATFPVLLAGPVFVWLVAGRAGGAATWQRRLALTGIALAVAAAVSSVWYVTNWREALTYIQSAYQFNTWEPQSRGEIMSAWANAILWEGLGLSLCILILTTLALLPFRAMTTDSKRRLGLIPLLLSLFLSGLPLVAGAVSSPNVSRRLLIPALVPLAICVVVLLGAVELRPFAARLRLALVGLVAIQWVALRGAAFSDTGLWDMSAFNRRIASSLCPEWGRRTKLDSRPAQWVLDEIEALRRDSALPNCYVMNNYAEISVPWLNLMRTVRGLKASIDWGTYFSWPQAQRRFVLDVASQAPSLLVCYDRKTPPSAFHAFVNRFVAEDLAFASALPIPFRSWKRFEAPDGSFTVEIYSNLED